MTTHLHHYVDGVCADPRAPGGPCGERQVYRAPQGQPVRFTDVLVDAADLAHVLEALNFHDRTPEQDAALERVQALLD